MSHLHLAYYHPKYANHSKRSKWWVRTRFYWVSTDVSPVQTVFASVNLRTNMCRRPNVLAYTSKFHRAVTQTMPENLRLLAWKFERYQLNWKQVIASARKLLKTCHDLRLRLARAGSTCLSSPFAESSSKCCVSASATGMTSSSFALWAIRTRSLLQKFYFKMDVVVYFTKQDKKGDPVAVHRWSLTGDRNNSWYNTNNAHSPNKKRRYRL